MNINIIAGKCSENNNRQIFEILKSRDKNKKHIIIAPDRCLFSLEKSLFDELGESCFFDISVASITSLSKKILNKKHDKKILTKNSGIALVRKLLNDNKEKLLSFKRASGFMGFAKTIFETICLYKSCNISPDDVYVDDSISYANLKQKDIKLIYTAYEEYLNKDYTDSFNQLILYSTLIDKDTYKDTIFYVMEFDDFTSIMYGILHKLSRFSDGIYISCVYGKGNNNSNIYSNKVYYDLVELYKTNGLNYKISYSKEFKDDTHNVILNNLLAYGAGTPKRASNIEVNNFDNIVDEIKFTIAKIYSLAIEEGVDYSHFGIVIPSISEYGARLVREIEKYKIPYYIDENKTLYDHILIRNFLDIWSIVLGDYLPADLINLIKSPLLNFDNESVLNYHNYLKMISAVTYNSIDKSMASGELLDFFNMITGIQSKIKDITFGGDFGEISGQIYDYIVGRSEKYVESLSDLDKRTFSQVQNKFNLALDDYKSVFGNIECSAKEYYEAVQVYFENTNISLPPITSNTVFIAGDSSYFTPVDYLFILGSNETKQPSFKLDNGLITDDEIARLPNASKINPTIRAINNRKTFKYFEYFLKYEKKLYLSYPTMGSESALYPSTMLLSLMSLFGLTPISGSKKLDIINASLESIDEESVVFNNLSENILIDNVLKLRKHWHTFEDKKGYRDLISTLYSASGDNFLRSIFNNEEYMPVKLVSRHNLFKNNRASISQIECYYNCPYKHFVNYGLRLRDTIKPRLMPNDIGTIYHLVLKDLLPYILSVLSDEEVVKLSQTKGRKLLASALSSEEYSGVLKNPENDIVLSSMYDELDRIVLAIVYQLQVSKFRPKYYEYTFNTKDFEVEGVRFTGSIDRVDILNNRFIIIDYKTGSNKFDDFSELKSGEKLQLLAYAKFFKDKTNLQPAGVFYLPISNKFNEGIDGYKYNGVVLKEKANIVDIDGTLSDGGVNSKVLHLTTKLDGEFYDRLYYKNLCLSAEDFNYILDYAISMVRSAMDNIIANNIVANPLKSDSRMACDKCNYRGLCNYMDNNERLVSKVASVEELKEESNG